MRPAIKFCGLTRVEDAKAAASAGARYGGVIFAGGPRNISVARANEVLGGLANDVLRVGVFGPGSVEQVASTANALGLHVVQLHDASDCAEIHRLRESFGGEVWAVMRSDDLLQSSRLNELSGCADGVLVDSGSRGTLGGTGTAFDWNRLSNVLRAKPGRVKLILAGGLTHHNVAAAIGVIGPDVVDVSSGVEIAPGLKDHEKMRRFAVAVKSTSEN